MTFTVFRLQPQGAFHFGEHGIGLEASTITFASDRLYSALFVTALQTNQFDWTTHEDSDAPNPPFRVSSCFPYVGTLPLLPIPSLPLPPGAEHRPGERKKFKKVRFVSPAILRHLLNDGSLSDYLTDQNAYQGGAVLIAPDDAANMSWPPDQDTAKPKHSQQSAEQPRRLWKEESVPHVTVRRLDNQPNYYETGQVHFARGCGLALLATGDVAMLETLLHVLGDSGIGGRRTKGLGQFEVEPSSTIDLPDPDTEQVMLLSRYIPTQAELEAGVLGLGASYNLVDVGGWVYAAHQSDQRRKAVRMIAEGSVVQTLSGTSPGGAVHDVRPEYPANDRAFNHPVWRYGLALTIGVPGRQL